MTHSRTSAQPPRFSPTAVQADTNGKEHRDTTSYQPTHDDEPEDINSIVKYTLEQQQRVDEDLVLEESQIDMDGGKVMVSGRKGKSTMVNIAPLMVFMRFKDRYETAMRSVKQMVFGYFIITDARKLKLAYSMTHSSTSSKA